MIIGFAKNKEFIKKNWNLFQAKDLNQTILKNTDYFICLFFSFFFHKT